MAQAITPNGIGIRFLAAVILVFSTYNPEGVSFYHWVVPELPAFSPLKIFIGVVLLIGWAIYIRATIHSLGFIGLVLAAAFFGSLLWVVVDSGLVSADNVRTLSYLVLVALCGILTAGISWSHIRRRISGQIDVDDTDGDLS
jgi:hypothetical protein